MKSRDSKIDVFLQRGAFLASLLFLCLGGIQSLAASVETGAPLGSYQA